MQQQSELSVQSIDLATRGSAMQRDRLVLRSERVAVIGVIFAAVCQGLLYLFLLPPWQHYDEPTHFEYAWLIANHPHFPDPGTNDQIIRREIAASMQEHNFYHDGTGPSLLTDNGRIPIGYSQLGDPPAYYALVSLPLRLVRHLDVASQLYVARLVSFLLFLGTIALTIGIMRDLTQPGHLLRWAVPLSMTLLPPFVDVMTAVNNDSGAVFVFTLFLWGSVRAIRYGLNWRRIAWLTSAAVLAVLTKNTAAIALLLVPLVVLVALWRQYAWAWRWFAVFVFGCTAVSAILLMGWGDAAFWYHKNYASTEYAPMRSFHPAAPVSNHAIMLRTVPNEQGQILVNPILERDLRQLAGHTVTVGAWVWADRPVTVSAFGVMALTQGQTSLRTTARPIDMSQTPTFVAWAYEVPPDIQVLNYYFFAQLPANETESLRIFLDGAVLVKGEFPTETVPEFDAITAQTGVWADQPFTNFVRNASAEQSWPHARVWFNKLLVDYTRRSPANLLATLLDVERTSSILQRRVAFMPFDSLFTTFAWGHVRLTNPLWFYAYRGSMLVALAGCVVWFVRKYRTKSMELGAVLFFFALTILLIWGNTFLRPLPLLDGVFIFPVARYAFPAMLPTMLALVGGWWALWPAKFRALGLVVIFLGLFMLNIAAVRTIWMFYQSPFLS